MSRLVWGASGSRIFETGVDRGVLFPPNISTGVPWNGLASVNEAPSGGDSTGYYMDGIKFIQVSAAEEYAASIGAFSAPKEFAACDGTANIYAGLSITQQPRKQFGFSYRTLIGNDTEGQEFGYKIHIVYGALAKPTSRNNQTLSESSNALDLSWDITTVPPGITGFKPSAHLVINSVEASSAHLLAIENMIYGSDGIDSRLPTITDLLTIFSTADEGIIITDMGDGTFTGDGDGITTDGDTYTINDSSITDNGDGTFTTT